MIGMLSKRFFHVGQRTLSSKSSALGKLRKSTGYSISNCKKALQLFQDDIKKAEEWLHAEAKQQGWSKWARIQSRSATQGLIGVCTKNTIGAMVEVNCETDFVARNADFQYFVENVLSSCINHINEQNLDGDMMKVFLNELQLNSLKYESSTINELATAASFKFNERMLAKRAVCFKVQSNISLYALSHPEIVCPNLTGTALGKYGTIVACKTKQTGKDLKELGHNLCQHIIGMNPSTIGEFTEKDLPLIQEKKFPKKDLSIEENSSVSSDEEDENVTKLKEINEARLMFQPFLLDPDVIVGETLYNAEMEVLQFERFECGDIEEPQAVAESVTA